MKKRNPTLDKKLFQVFPSAPPVPKGKPAGKAPAKPKDDKRVK